MKIDPPGYFESIVNQEINPQLNKNWAKDLHDKSVAPEIDEVITRYFVQFVEKKGDVLLKSSWVIWAH